MLSVVIATQNAERILGQTLAALVGGAMAGIVSEVILADGGSSDGTATIAESVGCRIEVAAAPLGDRLKRAAARSRSAWLLFLRPGLVLDSTWADEASRFIQSSELGGRADARAAAFRPPGEAESFAAMLGEGLTLILAALGGRPRPQQGLLISKSLYEHLGGHRGEDADPETSFLRRLGRRRIVLLRSRTILVAG
jgi:glycosyltransferase involved in cell wall biosynthesis